MKKLLAILVALVLLATMSGAEASMQSLTITAPSIVQLGDNGQAQIDVTVTATASLNTASGSANLIKYLTLQYNGQFENYQLMRSENYCNVNSSNKCVASHKWTYTYSGVPAGDVDQLIASAGDRDSIANGGYTDTTFGVFVNTQPRVVVSTPVAATKNVAYDSDFIDATDANTKHTFTFSAAGLPAGLQMDSATGRISGTPTQGGSFPVAVTVTDGYGGHGTQSFNFLVNAPANHSPTMQAIADVDAVAGQQLRVAVNANDQDAGDSITLSVDAASAALGMQIVISGQQSYVQWTPTAQNAGSHTVTVKATDSFGASATEDFTITVRNAPQPPAGNSAPVISSTPITSAVLEQTYRYEVLASDADGDTLTYALAQKPTGMTINGNVINWVPKVSGTFPVTVTVTDGQNAPVSQSFNVVVAPSLVLKSLEISADQAKPTSTFDVSFEVKNLWGADAENVQAAVKVLGLNGNNDLEQDVDFGRIVKQDTESGKATFQVPIDAKEKTYQVSVELTWEDENGVQYVADGQRTDSIKVKRMQHEVVLTESAFSSDSVHAGDSSQFAFSLANIGKSDENIQVKIQSDALGVQAFSPTFKLESGKETTQFLPFTIGNDARAGRQLVTITVLFNDGKGSNSQTTVLDAKAPAPVQAAAQEAVTVAPTGTVTVSQAQAPAAITARAAQPSVDVNLVAAVGIIAAAIVVTMAILVTAFVPPRTPRAPTPGSRVLRRGGQ